jgi:16S rRNA (adenine1518-N6/adenine1519-N6)-dimethyltransferase
MAKKYLGQHFLYDPAILHRIVKAADLSTEDLVVEIGPGPGKLTRLLAESAGETIAIELDDLLYENLTREFIAYRNVQLVLGDALKFPYENLGTFKVVSNIPYYITTPIIFRLIKATPHLVSMTLTIQREVAERIAATPGGKEYGVLSIMVQYAGIPSLCFIIPKDAFTPPPKVDSAVIHIRMREKPPVQVHNEAFFFSLVKTAFSQRRKMLSNSLRGISPDLKKWFARAKIDPCRRPETLSIEEFAKLANAFDM